MYTPSKGAYVGDPLHYFRSLESDRARYAGALISETRSGRAELRADLWRVCCAWGASGATFAVPDVCTMPATTEQDAWLWLWGGCSIDIDSESDMYTLMQATGLGFESVRKWLRVAVHNRLIYPDGSAITLIESLADRHMGDIITP